MPEVVYPSPDEDGSHRTWAQVFPIWENDDQHSEWRIINQILEAIAMNNRFGSKTAEELKAHLIKEQHTFYVKELKKFEGEPHAYRDAFGAEPKGFILPEMRAELMEDRARKFRFYGEWVYYLEEVFANLGGAYREYKNRAPATVQPTVDDPFVDEEPSVDNPWDSGYARESTRNL